MNYDMLTYIFYIHPSMKNSEKGIKVNSVDFGPYLGYRYSIRPNFGRLFIWKNEGIYVGLGRADK